VIEYVDFPNETLLPVGQSLGRLPNGIGTFAPSRITPGQPNAAP
jgi:hypothetical protein